MNFLKKKYAPGYIGKISLWNDAVRSNKDIWLTYDCYCKTSINTVFHIFEKLTLSFNFGLWSPQINCYTQVFNYPRRQTYANPKLVCSEITGYEKIQRQKLSIIYLGETIKYNYRLHFLKWTIYTNIKVLK